jgi:HK97 gp10 family phage protein
MTVTLPTNIEATVLNMINKTIDVSEPQLKKIVEVQAENISNVMQSKVTVDKGTLKASIGVSKSKKNNYFFWVGPQYAGKNSLFEGGNHGHLVEFGTKERYMKKGLFAGGFTRKSQGTEKFKGFGEYTPFAGKYTGVMKASPFVRPTYDSLGSTVIDNIKKETEKIILKEGDKQGL